MAEDIPDLENEPFISVLTPVYNGEKFLSECIESVLAQKYENWEYVIVNNCSTDRTLEIAESYAKQDSRIRIHNNRDFLDQMQNLNHAFRQISPDSKYCKVVHADDMLLEGCLEKMVTIAEEYPSVGLVSSYRLDGTKVGHSGLPYPSHFNDGKDISRDFLLGNSYYFGSPSSLLILSSLIRKRDKIYDESYQVSDITACLDLLKESDFGFVHQVLTFTRRHEDSVTSKQILQNSSHMLGYMKMHLEYGPYFLNDKEFKKVMQKRENIFHIQMARVMLQGNMREEYKRHAQDLNSVNLKVKNAKLLKYLIREAFRSALKRVGIKVHWY